jgi:AraC-like DNA-binding protein
MIGATREGFLRAPEGRFVRGRSWIFGCAHAGLYVTFLSGCPDEHDLRDLTLAYAVPLAAATPHATLFDASRVLEVDVVALALLLGFFERRAEVLTRRTERLAVVHADGVAGAVFAGYPKVLPIPCETRSFVATDAALRWLGCRAELRAELGALAASLDAEEAELGRLRALLGERPGTSMAEAARALGQAPRSLQRRMQRAGTSFQREADRARFDVATRRLLEGEDLATIARDVGFASQQSFTDWFRERTGEAPGSWRRRHGRRSPPV